MVKPNLQTLQNVGLKSTHFICSSLTGRLCRIATSGLMIIICFVLSFYYGDSFLNSVVYSPLHCSYLAPLKPFPPESQSLQILHVNRDHWIAVSTVSCTDNEDIIVFDSKYSLSTGTKLVLSQLIHTDKPSFNVKIASVSKQSGSADCGLYAIAYITSIAFGLNPTLCVFEQSAMRLPLAKLFSREGDVPFPNVERKTIIFNSHNHLHQSVLLLSLY